MYVGGGTLLSGVSYAGWGTPEGIINDKRPYWEQSLLFLKLVCSNGIEPLCHEPQSCELAIVLTTTY